MKGLITNKTISRALRYVLALVILFSVGSKAVSQQLLIPQIPKLSLVGSDGSYDRTWYPDGRIWLPPSVDPTVPREFLLPVFIDNRWYSYITKTPDNRDTIKYIADPIRSFKFKLYYDSLALRVVGIETDGPRHNEDDLDYKPLAYGWNTNFYDERDTKYWSYLRDPLNTPPGDNLRGRVLTIVGNSQKALPNTDLFAQEFKVLLYVRFRCVPTIVQTPGPEGNAPIYISNDTIQYNDLNVTTEAPFMKYRGYPGSTALADYPTPVRSNYYGATDNFTGLAGLSNKNMTTIEPPILPGVIYLRYMSRIPDFDFVINKEVGQQPPIRQINAQQELWEIVDPITVDFGSPNPVDGRRRVEVSIPPNLTQTRLSDITIESDSEWLKFQTVNLGANISKTPNPIRNASRFGRINWIDRAILDPNSGINDPMGQPLLRDGSVTLEVICDPASLSDDIEKTGIYVGYITFKSSFAKTSPVRIKVTFIYFRTAQEGEWLGTRVPGINLDFNNSRSTTDGGPQATNLIFGTGAKASVGVDSLYGEHEYSFPLQGFGARFYPMDKDGNDLYPFGMGDFAANDDKPKRSASRDIRNINDTSESIIYKVKFDAGGPQNYPVVITWDTKDFIPGSNLFIRDLLNGGLFPSINMRNATRVGGIGSTVQSFTILDNRIKEFIIEYTLPKVINYVDVNGKPIIKEGWNLLSLPVKPTNNLYTNVYSKSQNTPLAWYQSSYQTQTLLNEGVGYFIKYGSGNGTDNVDQQFTGTFISEVSVDRGNAVRVWKGDNDRGGWMTVGSLSLPVPVENMFFEPLTSGSATPDKSYTLARGIWGYKTNEGYKDNSVMSPGLGYWIKVNENGFYGLRGPFLKQDNGVSFAQNRQLTLARATALTIKDNDQKSNTVYLTNDKNVNIENYELPPVPQVGLFDVRFNSNTALTNNTEDVIRLQGVTYPLTIEVTNAKENITFTDAVSGVAYGTINKGQNGNIIIETEGSNVIKMNTTETTELNNNFVNYPNPVNTNTTIEYTITEDSNVEVNIYNELGNLVANLVNAHQTAGIYTVEFNANTVSAGTYLAKINTTNMTKTLKLSVIK